MNDRLPAHGLELTDEELETIGQDVPDAEFMDPGEADQDETVDNREAAEPPNDSSQVPDEHAEEDPALEGP